MEDKIKYWCVECEEEVDEYGYCVEEPCCYYAHCCGSCGASSCDDSCTFFSGNL